LIAVLLEMTAFSQSPRDRILWTLAAHGGKMERSRLRRCMGVEDALLNPILEELVREGKIRLTASMQGDIVSLISG
jgi:hypothetical protein